GNAVVANAISNNTLFGVELTGTGTLRNALAANSIHDNPAGWADQATGSGYYAQLNLDGYTAEQYNDPNSTAPNRGLNYPVVDSAVGSNTTGRITGHLDSSDDTYAIEVYASPTCQAGGYTLLEGVGSTTINDAFVAPPIYLNGTGN